MSINKMLFISLLTLSLNTGCASEWFVTHNGNMPTSERISKVSVGQPKNEVQSLLGSPSTVVSLDQNTWIYMSSDIKRVAFFKPEEVSRDVLTIKFNKDDKVSEIKRLKKENGIEVAVSEEETPTLGQDPGFFQKYFGGVGQYMPFGNTRSNDYR